MNSARLRFGVLGPLLIEADGAPVRPPRSPILRGLLGVLLVAAGRAVPADRLVELVWRERPDEVNPGSVQVAVSRLRQWLRRIDPTPAPSWSLDHYGSGYRLTFPDGRFGQAVDLGGFRALTAQAKDADDARERSELLEAALALWRGPLLADLPTLDAHDPLLRSVVEEVTTAAADLATAAAAAGRAGAALDRLAALAEAHPLDERLEAGMVELLAADGRTAEALRRYQTYRESVAEELGVDPGERMQAAYLAALAQDGRTPEALGVSRAPPPVPAQLPPPVPDFTGRDDQVRTLTDLLTAREYSPVTVITGLGGVGKTTLALHVAHRLAARFPDGQLYARLRRPDGAPVDPAEVLGGFLRAFGVSGQDVPASLDDRSALLRTVLNGRRVLILLDDATDEGEVRPLLPGAPGCAVVVTSRVPLAGLEGADRIDLDVFDQRQAVALLARIIGPERVAAEPRAAADVVRLCAHMPLAVRIAGTRLARRRHRTLAWLADRLGDARHRLDELTAGDLAVRASFRLSYLRLPDETRRLFRLLGLLEAPDFAEWVAAALLGGSYRDAQTHLETLVDAQLLVVSGTDANGWTRLRYHDLVRIYARERAIEEESEDARLAAVQRALGAWLALAERAAERVPGPCYAPIHGDAPRHELPADVTDRLLADPMAWFDAERAAMAAAVEHACALGLDDYAFDLAASMEKYLDVRSLAQDWIPLHEKAMALCAAKGNRLGEAVLLRGLNDMTTWLSMDRPGDAMGTSYDESTRLYRLFAEVGERRGMADALVAQCWGLTARGDSELALETARRALRLAQETDHLGGEARAHHVMGVAYGEARPEQAAEHLERCLELARLHGNPRLEATAMQFLGAAYCLTGRIESGHALLVGSLRITHQLKDHYAEAFSLLYLAKLYTALGDERALPTANSVVYLSRRHNLEHHLADAMTVLGQLDLAAGRYADAVTNLEESVRLWRARGWHSFLASTLRLLGQAHRENGDEEAARKAWSEALSVYERLGDTAAAKETAALLNER
ncbi:SARP family transcriptional regulator [Actinomadura sp. NBRC 104425]|uniref:BTAD domain-containing putative transcriptional regulator n=1 Tax=Actinomadura sp. NBRC 104425 TaxID=3032204 RepID=UPI0024A2CD8C|nr:BTAD domain-containing putative transcriptional regulator [Actinomadura sp. NBRC 104425]GLZ15041.1 SARP family transcriptional regulator [Actinomadura sp. NBRC 104425]